MNGPTGSVLSSQEHRKDSDTVNLEQAQAGCSCTFCVCQHIIISGPLPISVISTQFKRGKKRRGKKRYRKSSCKNKIQRALYGGKKSVDHFLTKCLSVKDMFVKELEDME